MESLDATELDSPEGRLACAIAQAPAGTACEAEAQLYRLLAPRVRRYGLRHLRDSQAAADLMQHVLAFTIEQLRARAVREPARVLSFVLGTCRMTVTDLRRTEGRRNELLERYAASLPQADIHIAPRLDHQRVADCLQRLAERERSVLVLTFYDDQPSEVVGTQLGLSSANVRVIRHRGLDKMRRCVDAGRVRA
ncbi:sigma-70 family RNA polymerase sigma factor [Ramlibacter algicola]|uniref:Sigma-70 family RNA polymerase sigma factor n=1 Tax=Ramlibacter algicola TaxID=2795217 RepID=A0A934Q0F2_9BURK|nr:sigma-70 family RNA polymerase sigma factor [Ramlibacter algicola]